MAHMTVGELLEDLRAWPETALVKVQVRQNLKFDGTLEPLYEFREADPAAVVYDGGVVSIQLDE